MQSQWTYLSDRGFIKVSGAAAEKFLQGQLTCDVSLVKNNISTIGANCNLKGRIVFTFRLFCWVPTSKTLTPDPSPEAWPREGGDGREKMSYWLCLPRNQVDHAVTTLKKYAAFSKVLVEDMSDQVASIGFIGGCQGEYFQGEGDYFPSPIYGRGVRGEGLDDLPHLQLPIPGITPRIQFIAPREHIKNIRQQLSKEQEAPLSTWKAVDIESGIAEIYPETREQFTPHDINYHLLGGVSFDKGCYIGQEIVARMHYLGKLKTSLILLSTLTPNPSPASGRGEIELKNGAGEASFICSEHPKLGEKILTTDAQLAGFIVDFVEKNAENYLVLGSISKIFIPAAS